MGPDPRTDRRERVLAVVDSIPRGKVATYGEVAREAGLPGRARWVGRVLRELPPGALLPWHRVLGAPGRLALPAGSRAAKLQRRRLLAEGVEVSETGRVDLRRFGWSPSS